MTYTNSLYRKHLCSRRCAVVLRAALAVVVAGLLVGCSSEEEPALSRPDVGFAPRSGLAGAAQQTTVPLLSGGAGPQSLAAPNSMMAAANTTADSDPHARIMANSPPPSKTEAPTQTPGSAAPTSRALPLDVLSGDDLTTKGRAAAMNPAIFQMPDVPKTNVTFTTDSFTAANVRFLIPMGWKSVPTTSPMRLTQFEIPGSAGPAELIVFYFGPGQGGSAEANVRRWVGMFKNPAGGEPDTQAASLETDALRIALIRARGIYTPQAMMPGAPAAPPQPDSALFGLVIEGGTQGSLFLRATGPAATMDEQSKNFEFFAQNIREVTAAKTSPTR